MRKDIGKRFRLIREQKNISQTEMGSSLGIQYQHVSKYERGESVPTWENLIKMIELYNVNINWLLTGRGNMYLTPLGYDEVSDSAKHVVRDGDIQLDEIVEELKNDSELKTLVYNYLKNYWGLRQAITKLKDKADNIGKGIE